MNTDEDRIESQEIRLSERVNPITYGNVRIEGQPDSTEQPLAINPDLFADIKMEFPIEHQQFLLVNGPPRSGKDTVGRLLQEFYPGAVYVTKFAKILKERTHALYGLIEDGKPLPHDYYEDLKDKPHMDFLGLTPRQTYIGVSELLFKAQHGQDIFGKLLLEDIMENGYHADLVVVTDSGFEAEAKPVIEAYGREKSQLVRLMREGCSFVGDSRGYIGKRANNEMDLTSFDHAVYNNGSTMELVGFLSKALGFDIPFRVEVQIPGPSNDLIWWDVNDRENSLDSALVVVEALRRHSYGQRVMRVVAGRSTVVRLVMPGDAPVAEFGT